MTIFAYGDALEDYQDPYNLIDMEDLTIAQSSSTSVTVLDPFGHGYTITGTGLTYSANSLTGGVVESLTFFLAGDENPLVSFTEIGLNVPVSGFGLVPLEEAFGFSLLAGDDLVLGSREGNIITGGAGDDTIKGGGGEDIFIELGGRDKLVGGRGADIFHFNAIGGKDVISDFTDRGGRGDDVIMMTQEMFDQMSLSQRGDDVLIKVGDKSLALIKNILQSDLGADDIFVGNPFDFI